MALTQIFALQKLLLCCKPLAAILERQCKIKTDSKTETNDKRKIE
jgi:hypothetical protein